MNHQFTLHYTWWDIVIWIVIWLAASFAKGFIKALWKEFRR